MFICVKAIVQRPTEIRITSQDRDNETSKKNPPRFGLGQDLAEKRGHRDRWKKISPKEVLTVGGLGAAGPTITIPHPLGPVDRTEIRGAGFPAP